MDDKTEDRLALGTLANGVRQKILTLLHERPRSVGDVTSFFNISRPAISRHLKVLLEAGFVRADQSGRSRVYPLDEEALEIAVTRVCPPPRAVGSPFNPPEVTSEQPEWELYRTQVRTPNGKQTAWVKHKSDNIWGSYVVTAEFPTPEIRNARKRLGRKLAEGDF